MLLAVSWALLLFVVLRYVPGVTGNKILDLFLTVSSSALFLFSGVAGLVLIVERLGEWGWVGDEESSNPSGDNLSSPARGFVETDEERMQRAMEALEGWFVIRDAGRIVLQPEPDRMSSDQRGMLYVFASRVAYDAGERDSPKVSKREVRDRVDFTSASAGVFIDKMYDENEYFIELDYDPESREALMEMGDEDMLFELNLGEVSEVVRYIKGERRAPN